MAFCGGADVQQTVFMGFLFSASVTHITASANGHSIASAAPTKDATTSDVSTFAVSIPGATKTVSVVVNGSVHETFNVASCLEN